MTSLTLGHGISVKFELRKEEGTSVVISIRAAIKSQSQFSFSSKTEVHRSSSVLLIQEALPVTNDD